MSCQPNFYKFFLLVFSAVDLGLNARLSYTLQESQTGDVYEILYKDLKKRLDFRDQELMIPASLKVLKC